jgi:hypothetical protein
VDDVTSDEEPFDEDDMYGLDDAMEPISNSSDGGNDFEDTHSTEGDMV